jgi:hypothetical protein
VHAPVYLSRATLFLEGYYGKVVMVTVTVSMVDDWKVWGMEEMMTRNRT